MKRYPIFPITPLQGELFDEEEEELLFNMDPIAIALIRCESIDPVPMTVIDGDPRTEEICVLGGYLERANEIRSYYKKKLFYGTLSNRFTNTNFRNDLQACLERKDIHTVKRNEIGMVARLPDFYNEDVLRDQLTTEADTKPKTQQSFYSEELLIKYRGKTLRRYGKDCVYTYWFMMKNAQVCSFNIQRSNPLLAMFDKYIQENKIIKVEGGFNPKHQDDFYFYHGKCKVLV